MCIILTNYIILRILSMCRRHGSFNSKRVLLQPSRKKSIILKLTSFAHLQDLLRDPSMETLELSELTVAAVGGDGGKTGPRDFELRKVL